MTYTYTQTSPYLYINLFHTSPIYIYPTQPPSCSISKLTSSIFIFSTHFPLSFSPSISFSKICLAFGFSRTGFFAWLRTRQPNHWTEAAAGRAPALAARCWFTLPATKLLPRMQCLSGSFCRLGGRDTTTTRTSSSSTYDPPSTSSPSLKISTSSSPCTCTTSSSRTATRSKLGTCSTVVRTLYVLLCRRP